MLSFATPTDGWQFEWAWQNPDKSRHLKSTPNGGEKGQYIFKKDARRNRVERKAMCVDTS